MRGMGVVVRERARCRTRVENWSGTCGGRRMAWRGGRRPRTTATCLTHGTEGASRFALCAVANIRECTRTHRQTHVCAHIIQKCTIARIFCLCLHAFLVPHFSLCVRIVFAQPYSAGARCPVKKFYLPPDMAANVNARGTHRTNTHTDTHSRSIAKA